jgi:hypothetical protein
MIALESRLEQRLAGLVAETTGYLEAPAVVGEWHALVTKQHEALKAHVQVLDHPDVSFTASALSAAFEAPPGDAARQTRARNARLVAGPGDCVHPNCLRLRGAPRPRPSFGDHRHLWLGR